MNEWKTMESGTTKFSHTFSDSRNVMFFKSKFIMQRAGGGCAFEKDKKFPHVHLHSRKTSARCIVKIWP